VSGLAHYFEDEGLSTVLVALVREHAVKVQPPRALWVPFMLGRPFGEPNNSELQKSVIRECFGLLDEGTGPVIRDSDLTAPELDEAEGWTCPVSFSRGVVDNSVAEKIAKEIALLRPWYNLRVKNGNRTTVGLSNSSIEDCANGLERFIARSGESSNEAKETANNLRWWSSDLKAFYMEAVLAQPGKVKSSDLENWFWNETATGSLFREIRNLCIGHASPDIREVGLYMIGEIESEYYVREYSEA
jgi:hypothetical protein